jgi:UDP-glucose 4-epimerase
MQLKEFYLIKALLVNCQTMLWALSKKNSPGIYALKECMTLLKIYAEEKMMNPNDVFTGKQALIIGGAGFIGSNLSKKLVEYGAHVNIADILHPDYGGNLFNLEPYLNEIKFNYTDLRDEFGMKKLVENMDFIFNLAAQVSYTDSMKIPYIDLDINCRGHLQFLEICKDFNPNASIVFTSSRMVYGKISNIPVSELHPTNPLSLYATHKLAAEKYYYLYNHTYGMDTKIVRIANPYGPRNQMKNSKYGIANWFLRCAMEDKEIKIFGDGSQIRDYIYIDDIVNGLLSVASQKRPKENVYNLGSGIGTSFSQMIDTIISVVGKGKKTSIPWPDNYEKMETGDYIADISRLRNVLGQDYMFAALERGMEKTHDFYSEYRLKYF